MLTLFTLLYTFDSNQPFYLLTGNESNLIEEMKLVKSLILNGTHGDRANVSNLWFIITDQTPDQYNNETLEFINEIKDECKMLMC